MTPNPGVVESALRALFPDGIAVAAVPIIPADDTTLWPNERAAIAGAVPSRLAEFVAGRTAARQALHALGFPPTALPMAPDRAALWPKGVSGAIAHAAGIAIAVARRGGPLGVDVEDDTDLPHDIWPIICLPEELQRLQPDRLGRDAKRVFCAKEAVFKAQAPESRAMFGHEILSVSLAETSFDAQFLADAGAFRSGQVVQGRIALVEGLILAGVAG
jgi:4'-phosphopantetheinyl transferase EntD